MSLTVINAYRPTYADAVGSAIMLDVRFSEYPDLVGFLARPDDSEPHGRDLYHNAKAGKYGQIARYPASDADLLRQRKLEICSRIDQMAEAIRLTYITPGSGQAMIYKIKGDEADRIVNDPDPDPNRYPALNATVGIDGATLADVAAAVRAARAAWTSAAVAIEAARLSGKAAVMGAANSEAIDSAFSAIVWPPRQGA